MIRSRVLQRDQNAVVIFLDWEQLKLLSGSLEAQSLDVPGIMIDVERKRQTLR